MKTRTVQHRIMLLSLGALLAGCSMQPTEPEPEQPSAGAFCLRSGESQAFDCSAPPLSIQQVRDPLAPGERISDEELMTLLADIKRWLARRRLILEGKPIPPELQPRSEEPALLPRLNAPLWPRVMNSISRPSLQRSMD
ncbi:hypothetical protein H9C73_06605 [Marinobacterium sp. AK62]|uniref:Lipoprotein n=1 Tax=Marinobacterium alkalitolerans TaxID=1542925 RepID=A0ABS3Z9L6_9GAMM|nr:hypothetical protein [Marinobacterium alkalitolerans]MBP0048400.1 hypothetical protein [Marinobacterium alkalitolerans]